MIKISNDKLVVIINEKGAELQSIRYINAEYLWQADANYWGKHAPVLFPIVGELKNGEYIFKNKTYKLPRHGFARDKLFAAQQISDTSVQFTLQDDEATLTVYPFKFIFRVEFTIIGAELSCSYVVKNAGADDMYFSVGGHPAFNIPIAKDLNYTDYFLKFNNDAVLSRYLLQNGLISDTTEQVQLNNKTLQLQASLFYSDAIVLKNMRSNQIKLYSDKDDRGLKFSFNEFPYFGIWAAANAPFICLEPWCGIADNVDHDCELIHKEGIIKLAANESWKRTWSIELF